MTAINFKQRFAHAVACGQKRQTIRARGKRRPPEVGEALQLYTGMRTMLCKKLVRPDPVCTSVEPITISTGLKQVRMIQAYGVNQAWLDLDLKEIEALATADGFNSVDEFFGFFEEAHGPTFSGYLIKW